MELSNRLQTVAAAVTPGSRIADVGTDHGYIPVYLVSTGICPGAIAMDVNKGPLSRAVAHICAEGLSGRIETRQSDGLAALSPEETDTVVIAGMGGALICRILRDAPQFFAAGKELILQPQSEWFKVRHFLHDAGYRIRQEWFLKEEGKYYVVIKASSAPSGTLEAYPDELSYRYGALLLQEKHPVLQEYLLQELKKKRQIIAHMTVLDPITPDAAEENLRSSDPESPTENPSVVTDDAAEEKRKKRRKELEEEIREIEEYMQKNT